MDAQVRAELLHLVYCDQPLSLIAAWVFSATVTILLSLSPQSDAFPWWWLLGITVTLALRLALAYRYRRAPRNLTKLRLWERRFFVGTTVTALFWGTIVGYAYPVAPSELRVIVMLMIGGVVAAASRTIACQLPAFVVYAVISSLPLLAELFVDYGRQGVLTGSFATLYVLLMLGLGRSFQRTIANTFRLQFQNADLANQLQRDIAAREAAESALRASEERLRFAHHALDRAQDLVAIFDREGNFLYVSEAFCHHSGRTSEELGRTKLWSAVAGTDPETFAARWEQAKRTGAIRFETEVVSTTGSRLSVEVNASFVEFNGHEAICAIGRDLAPRRAAEQEKERLQQQLQETQRLESLGVLAGGIAHDFNNLLTAILGNASLARDTLHQPRLTADMLSNIETAANQAAGLCRQMLAYAGRGQLRVEPLDLSTVVNESAKLLEVTAGQRARLQLQLHPALPSIVADASQLRQIVLNLVHNAAEAINRPDGRIVVTTSPMRVDQGMISAARIRTEISPGDGVALIVADNGNGMDRETLDRIFEPFFTTKFTGRGLGLPAVLGIVRSHRALLHVESTPGLGSTFRVVFSAAEAPALERRSEPAAALGRHEGIALIIEDESSVRHVAQQVILRMGFQTEVAECGRQALTMIDRDPHRFTVMLVDMTMPEMDGAETLVAIRRLGVRAPAIVMSGMSEQQVRERVPSTLAAEFLQKPFDVETLRLTVQRALEGAAGAVKSNHR